MAFPTIRQQAGFGPRISRRLHDRIAGVTAGATPPSNLKSVFTVQQPAADRLILDGDLDGKKLHMETTYVDRTRFLLVNRGFNWIQEVPFNR